MHSLICRTLLLASLSVNIVACADSPPIRDSDGFKADGFEFVRELSPRAVQLDQASHTGTFDESKYIAYSFELEQANRVSFVSEFSWLDFLVDRFDKAFLGDNTLEVGHALFTRSSSEEEWDLIRRISDRHIVELQAGQYLTLVLASPEAYEEELSIGTEIVGTEVEDAEPGTVRIRLVVKDDRDGAGVRVALGAQAGYTDERGVVELRDVPRGFYEVKIGPEGLEKLEELFVIGHDKEQVRVFVLESEQYDDNRE